MNQQTLTDQELLERLLQPEGYQGYRLHEMLGSWYPQRYDRWWRFCDKTVGKYAGCGSYYSYKRQSRALAYLKSRLEGEQEDNEE